MGVVVVVVLRFGCPLMIWAILRERHNLGFIDWRLFEVSRKVRMVGVRLGSPDAGRAGQQRTRQVQVGSNSLKGGIRKRRDVRYCCHGV